MGASRLLAAFAIAFALSGCVTHTASPAVQGRAYVVNGNVAGTTMLNCDARSGVPECWPVRELERPEEE